MSTLLLFFCYGWWYAFCPPSTLVSCKNTCGLQSLLSEQGCPPCPSDYGFFITFTVQQLHKNTGKHEAECGYWPHSLQWKRRGKRHVSCLGVDGVAGGRPFTARPHGAQLHRHRHKEKDSPRLCVEIPLRLSGRNAGPCKTIKTINSLSVIFYLKEWQKLREEIKKQIISVQCSRPNKFWRCLLSWSSIH